MNNSEKKILIALLLIIPILHSFFASSSFLFSESLFILKYILFSSYLVTYLVWIVRSMYYYFCSRRYSFVIMLVIHIILTIGIPEYYLNYYLWQKRNMIKLNHAVITEMVPHGKGFGIYYLYEEEGKLYETSLAHSYTKVPILYENYKVGDSIKITHLVDYPHISKWEIMDSLSQER